MEQFVKVVLGLLIITGVMLLCAWPVLWITNYLFTPLVLTTIFGGSLTYWKAFWLSWLTASLFKSYNTKE